MAATSPQVVFCGAYREPVSQRQVDPGQDPKSTVDTDFFGKQANISGLTDGPSYRVFHLFPIIRHVFGFEIQNE